MGQINYFHQNWCDYWFDYYPFECTCGLTASKPDWVNNLSDDDPIKQYWKILVEEKNNESSTV